MTAIVLADNAYGTLGVSIASTDSAITLTTGHGARFPTIVAGQALHCVLVNSSNVLEEIQVTAHSTGTGIENCTVTRGVGSTTAKAWSAGDRIEARLSRSVLQQLPNIYFDASTVDEVCPDWYGAKSYTTKAAALAGVDSTAAINTAIATGKKVRCSRGFYASTGGHSLDTIGQGLYGAAKGDIVLSTSVIATTLVKLSGSADMLTTTQTDHYVHDIAIDRNSLGGAGLVSAGAKYSTYARLGFIDAVPADTHFAVWLKDSGVTNLCTFHDLQFSDGHYGHIKIDNALYCNFFGVRGGALGTGGVDSIEAGATQAYAINFYGVFTEGRVRARAACVSMHIFGLAQEAVTATQCVLVNAGQDIAIHDHFVSRGASTQPVYDFQFAAINCRVKGARIRDTGSLAGNVMASIDGGCFQISYEDVEIYSDNSFYFVNCTGARSDKVSLKNVNSHSGGAGTNQFKCAGLSVQDSNLNVVFVSGNNDFAGMNISGNINTDNATAVSLVNCTSLTDGGGLAVGHQI